MKLGDVFKKVGEWDLRTIALWYGLVVLGILAVCTFVFAIWALITIAVHSPGIAAIAVVIVSALVCVMWAFDD